MAKLILTLNGATQSEFPLDKERLTIGRRPSHDIQIDNLAVSGDHAAIVSIYNYHFIEDLGSTNGTLVNGKEIKKQVLSHNDVITLGKHELRYVNPEAAASEELQKTVMIRPRKDEGDAAAPATPPVSETTAPPPDCPAWLVMENGPNRGKRLELTMTATSIGRQGAPLATVLRKADGFYISGGSKHQPLVNGQAVNSKLLLRDGDKVQLDSIQMTFHLRK